MQENLQKTINDIVAFQGVGLHSGNISNIRLLPAKENQGIIFKRVDLRENNTIEANYKNVSSAKLCTTLENSSGIKVSTVEHLLAALYIAGVDNATIEIDNQEIPIMDGSSKNFVETLLKIGTKNLNKERKFLKVLSKIELEDNGRKISIEPSNLDFEVNFKLNYSNDVIGQQKNTVNLHNDNLEDVYSSRTFCLFEDIEKIKKLGLAKGGSLENAIVVNQEKIMNENGLRNEKEFVNHKILDLVGDFLLSGYRILGKVNCQEGGHQLSNMFLRKFLKSEKSYEVVKLNNNESLKKTRVDLSIKLAVNA